MSFKEHGRQYDLVVLGASGYTGQLTAEHIVTHLPTNLKWAVAGRSLNKLQAVVEQCKQLNADREAPVVELADTNNEEQLVELAKKTHILITTVGPYCIYGEKVVKVCAETGTHYLDCTGEFPWVRSMIKKYEKSAQASGALLFPQFGIESAPADLCAYLLAQSVRKETGSTCKDVTLTIAELNSAPSGGTLATVLSIFDKFSLGEVRAATGPYALSPIKHAEPSRKPGGILQTIFGSHYVPELGSLTTSPAGSTDATQVERSWGLFATTPSLQSEQYGPNFRFAEYYTAKNWLAGVGIHWALLLGGLMLAIVPPVRSLVKMFVYQPGQGPEKSGHHKESIEYRGFAHPDVPKADSNSSKKAYVKARFEGGSMYYLTGLLLAQGALTLLEEDVQLEGGFYTPACLKQPLVDRVNKVGFKTETRMLA